MRRPLGLLLVGAVLALPVAGCSGDDDGDSGAGEDTARTSTTSTTVVFTGDPSSPFCGVLREVELEGALDEDAPSPEAVEAGFTTVIDALARVAEAAPPELAEDTALVLAGMVALDDALRAVGYDYDALASDPAAAVAVSQAANDPAFAVASARIEAYREQVCRS